MHPVWRIGTAGWAIPRVLADRVPGAGTHLERYARLFACTEINSSFHRSHTPSTYARWARSTPDGFSFSVKVPRVITHDRRLCDVTEPLAAFLKESAGLGEKRGPLLVQLPPSLAFDVGAATAFFDGLRQRHDGPVVCEPRHPSWFTPDADALLAAAAVGRVAADPARVAIAAQPGGHPAVPYFRLHGSPRTYYSPYETAWLDAFAARWRPTLSGGAWCVFDNTASGAALGNALDLRARLTGAA
jgi:uncharacterized protein YecE (DUF72 family)